MTWLLDTLVWTGAFIALVLGIRRPVARQFGARAAYALWALPLLRMMLPPVVLPDRLAPVFEPVAPATAAAPMVAYAPTGSGASFAASAPGIDWAAILTAVWLAGAAAYVVVRLVAYARLRRELLANARPVGDTGRVRLLETPAAPSPLAFGIFDKVIALPPGFMAMPDRTARDLALAHELAHHSAHDLAANFAALPLFALHWFNPLSWLGWNAMRRDQEAACDARVVEHRDRSERLLYAAVIARAAAVPQTGFTAALAAPMACPVLGDKSIIHRLRTLSKADHSRRRRRAGGLLIGTAALALPLTASVSYARGEPAVTAAAANDGRGGDAQATIALPHADAGGAQDVVIAEAAGSGKMHRRVLVTQQRAAVSIGSPSHVGGAEVRGADGRILRPGSPEFEEQLERTIEREMEELDERIERSMAFEEDRIERAAEAADYSARAVARATARADAASVAAIARARSPRPPKVVSDCASGGGSEISIAANGARVVQVCQKHINRNALSGLREARARIDRKRDMPAEVRVDILADLDAEIAQLEAGK